MTNPAFFVSLAGKILVSVSAFEASLLVESGTEFDEDTANSGRRMLVAHHLRNCANIVDDASIDFVMNSLPKISAEGTYPRQQIDSFTRSMRLHLDWSRIP